MCPICISAAALAAMAGSGSTGGLAALAAVKLRVKQHPGAECALRKPEKSDLQSQQTGDGK